MTMNSAAVAKTTPPSEEEQLRELRRILQLGPPTLIGATNQRVELPDRVYNVLKDAVHQMATGYAVAVVAQKQLLTTQTAADILGFSRPHLIKLLETGAIPYQKVGRHRRLWMQDVLAFQQKRDQARKNALDEIAQEAFRAGHYEGTGIRDGESDE
jgi:excisionase family DNA binding protein